MARVLFANELGMGSGHVSRLVPVARQLADAGHDIVFVVPALLHAARLVRALGAPVLQAPICPAILPMPGPDPMLRAHSLADILARFRFADADALGTMVAAWDALLALLEPALVVCDHSPTLCLATHQRIPTVIIGDGYTLPPSHGAWFPPYPGGSPPTLDQTRILDTVNAVLGARGQGPLARLPELLDGAIRFVCVVRELDVFRDSRAGDQADRAIGPLLPQPAPGPDLRTSRFFAYLYRSPALAGAGETMARILCGLANADTEGEVYYPEAPPALRALLAEQGVIVHDTPRDLHQVLARVSAVVHLGGLGTAQSALAAGVPQLVLPHHFEAELNAGALQSLGVASALPITTPEDDIAAAVDHVAGAPALRTAARDLARQLHARERWDAADIIAARCLRALACA